MEKEKTIKQIALENQIAESSLRRTIKNGMNIEEAITHCKKSKKEVKKVCYLGELVNVYEIERREQLLTNSLYNYLYSHPNCKVEEAVATLKKIQLAAKDKPKVERNRRFLFPDELGILVPMRVSEIAELVKVSKSAMNRQLAKGKTIEEAIETIISNQPKRYLFRGNMETIPSIVKITGVAKNYLYRMQAKEDFAENIEWYIQAYQRPKIIEYEGVSLYQYCVQHGYDYYRVYHMIKYENLSIPEALFMQSFYGIHAPHHWNYEYEEIIIRSICIKYHQDPNYVLEQIKKGLSLEEAMEKSVFCSCTKHKSRSENERMLMIYHSINMLIPEERYQALMSFHLTEEEMDEFENSYNTLSILKRELFLMKIRKMFQNSSPEERVMLAEGLQLTQEELRYMEEGLLEGFVPVKDTFETFSKKLSKTSILTYSNVMYYNRATDKEQEQ